eukprot:CAMPEP_0170079764 /NCGR_PEP_ID=MMETSP0019_2-20121128/16058_1 /TAXON_ID=98059 /ORGANISM="Dinobryon sp., Strain UTEXLB2267" /LENGTH=407 /DNA_ID=CAMNT_0010293373 /DNA_START=253 /DNA_END=1476 /DNA_ORIENTATION=+
MAAPLTDLQLYTGPNGEKSKKVDFSFIERYQTARKIGLERSKAKFSPAGHAFIQSNFASRIAFRLRFVDYLKRHPRVLDMKIKPPVFVIGFPRTGTTFLFELLGLHESVRVHRSWEQIYTIPGTEAEDAESLRRDRARRYQANKWYFNNLLMPCIGEAIQHVHRIGYDEPEECTIPCSFDLPWTLTELPFSVFAADELAPLGVGDAFRFYRQYLQLLAWQQRGQDSDQGDEAIWMLKCPFHLPYLQELCAVFPGCTVVWTHRNPRECVASACSLYETVMRMAMEEASIDPVALGQAVMRYTELALQQAEASLKLLGDRVKVIHVRYADNIKNPKQICRTISEQAGLGFSETYEAQLDAYLQRNAEQRQKMKEQNRSQAFHDYKPEHYGLTETQIQAAFQGYISKYGL